MTKKDPQGRLFAMKLYCVVNRWDDPNPYQLFHYNENAMPNVGPDLSAPQYLHSSYQNILRFSTNADRSNPVIRSFAIDNEKNLLYYNRSDYWEEDTLREWSSLVYNKDLWPYTNVSTGIIPTGTLPNLA